MKVFIAFCILICVANSLPTGSYQTEWKNFKATYGKQYLTTAEEDVRFHIFSKNLDEINEHNKQYDLGLTSYKMSVNKFADLTEEEYQKMLGLLPNVHTEVKLSTGSYQTEWKKFKATYGKQYLTTAEEDVRFHIFSKNLDEINEHNKQYDLGLTSYKMSVNQFSDMTQEEYKKMLGLLPKIHTEVQLSIGFYQTEWKNFKATYGKQYLTTAEEDVRFYIFSKNLDEINKHNKQYELGLTSYKMSVNQFTDMTQEEYQKMLGLLPHVHTQILLADVDYQQEWQNFKQKYNRLYSTQEDKFRFEIFSENLRNILNHNEDYKKGITTFEMEVNNFSDMTHEELQKFMGTRRPQDNCQPEWIKFKETYSRTFTTSEDNMRYKIFCNNLVEVEQHNADFEKGMTTYKNEINQFADRTPEEMKKLMGYRGQRITQEDDICKEKYAQFKKTYNKVYQTEDDELNHLKIFCDNLKTIKQHNKEYDQGLTTFKMGVNIFTDMTPEEIKHYMGYLHKGEASVSFLFEGLSQELYQSEWENFKKTFAKSYLSNEEEQHRFEVFSNNLDEITEHNQQYEKGLTTFKMAVNKFSDLTHEEFHDLLEHGL